MKRMNNVRITWDSELAYAIGIIASDGNLSPDMRHINITSKDEDLILNMKACLRIQNKIGRKSRGYELEKKYFVVQFGDVRFFEFLEEIGLHPAKSKTLKRVAVPKKYFRDFSRGCFDGDGNIDIHTHPQSKLPQLKTRLSSASYDFLYWMKHELVEGAGLEGGWIGDGNGVFILSFGKKDSIKLFKFMYYKDVHDCFLARKYEKVKLFL